MEFNEERLNIVLAAAVKKYGPFMFEEPEIVDNTDGFMVGMENGLLIVESWNGEDPEAE